KIDAETRRIETLAGTGTGGFGGDGGAASAALLSLPSGVAVDAAGNVYVADRYNHRVRIVDAGTGRIETLAGTGTGGFGGDGGPASAALLNLPSDVAADAAGNVYVADRNNHRVRRIDGEMGWIETLAGTVGWGFGGDGGAASAALLRAPSGVAVDAAGNVYVADRYNHRVRIVDAGTGRIKTLAGTGQGGFGGDGGPASAALLNQPIGVAVNTAGNVFVADTANHRVRALSPQTLVKFPLGTDGEFVILSVSKGGLLTLDSETVVEGTRITRNGREYELTARSEGGVLATLVPSGPAPENFLLDRDWMATADAAMVTAQLDLNGTAVLMDSDARTPLHLAAWANSDPAVAQALLDRGASLHVPDAQGRRPLHYAALGGNAAVVDLLLDRDAQPFLVDNDIKTAQDLATESGNTAVAEQLADRAEQLAVPDPYQVPTWRLLFGDWAVRATVASVTAVLDADPEALSIQLRIRGGLLNQVARLNSDPEVTRLLLDRGADANAETSTGTSVLEGAARNPNPAVMELLLDRGADTTDLNALLRIAVWNQNEAVARLLLDRGADPTDPAAITRAASNENPAVVRLLLDRGADPNAEDSSRSALAAWARFNQNPAVGELLLNRGADINAVSGRWESTALHGAMQNANPAVARLLIDRGADINAQDTGFLEPLCGETDQYTSGYSVYRHPAPMQVLIDVGGECLGWDTFAKLATFNQSGLPSPGWNLALKVLRSGSVTQVADLLDELHPQTLDRISEAHQDRGYSLLLDASENPNPAVAELLLDRGEQQLVPQSGRTALRWAAAKSPNPAVAELLVLRGADVYAADNGGWAALHFAAQDNPNPAVSEVLIGLGADTSVADRLGRTPLHLSARFNPNPAVTELLAEGGADLEAGDDGDATPWLLAGANFDAGVAAALVRRGAQRIVLGERLLEPEWLANATPTQLEAQVISASDQQLFDSWDECGRTPLHLIGYYTAVNEIHSSARSVIPDSWRIETDLNVLRVFNDRAHSQSILALDGGGNTVLHYILAGAAKHVLNYGDRRSEGLRGLPRFNWAWRSMRKQFQETVSATGLQAAHYASRLPGDFSSDVEFREGQVFGTTPLLRSIGPPSNPYGDFTVDPLSGMQFPNLVIPRSRLDPCLLSLPGHTGPAFWDHWTYIYRPGGPGVVPPPPPPPPPPPFEGQEYEVALGASGDKVTLVTTESGGFTLNGEAFESGDTVTANDGSVYVLTLDDGVWTSTLKP
ncbi:MAG: ankyrin repeat domain-containing protein, partial [Bryobacterales bacterium]|nr:ankyrin repeat domain-containing protein [Bryobacterales bacterium]